LRVTREDFPQIAKSAKALRAMGVAAVWIEPKLGSQVQYGRLSLAFQHPTDDIASRASEKNRDGATLGYLRSVTTCMRCYRNICDAKK
jgi:hypothetical protein